MGTWWPLILIVMGANALTRHQTWGRILMIVILVIVVLVVGFWSFRQPTFVMGGSTENISQPLSAARAEIKLSTTVGRLEITANDSGNLIDGTLMLSGNDRLEREFGNHGTAQFVRLEAITTGSHIGLPGLLGGMDWNLGLSPKIPLVLRINTGVGNSRLDLTQLEVTNLNLNSGIGKTTVLLPAAGLVTAVVESGIGEMNISIPDGVKARVHASSGLGTVRVLGNFQHSGELYTSSGFENAPNRIDLEVKGGIGQVTVEQSGR